MASPSTATEPAWLTARRERAVSLRESLPLPSFRGNPGWEFTSLKGLDLDAFGSPEDVDVDAAGLGIIDAPENAILLEQVDHVSGGAARGHGRRRDRHAAERRDPVASRPRRAALRLDRLAREPVRRAQRGRLAGRRVRLRPARRRARRPDRRDRRPVAGRRRHCTGARSSSSRRTRRPRSGSSTSRPGTTQKALFSTVTELSIGQNARLRYVCAQGLSEKSWIFGAQRAVVGRDAALDWIALGFGAGNGRVAMDTELAGPGADAKVTGAYATHGRQHLDYATTQEHAAANTTSDLAFRGILDGRSNTVWSGMIKVDPGAQQIDAFQESRNLLLTKTAHADAIPGLEILANDVRCTHAAAIAQIDPEQLYYLRSRGLLLEQAKRLVIEGFLEATVERFEAGPFREAVAGALERRLEAVLG